MTTPTSVLLVATATRWLGTARIPRGLAKAGFTVALLTPRQSLAEKSRFIAKIGFLPDQATPMQWVHAFAATVTATSPRLVIPCDDMAFRLLQMLALTPPPRMQPALQLRLAALVRESLGDPAHYQASTDKTLLPAAAEALGLRVPPFAVCAGADDIAAFAATQDWPVVVKRRHGFAGQGVAICADRNDVARALAAFAAADARDLADPAAGPARYLAQAHLPGRTQYFMGVAWNGRLLAGYAGEKIIANPEPTGPPTVTRYFRSPPLRAMTEQLVTGFGMCGYFVVEFRVDERTQDVHLIEINRRISPATHLGALRNVDFSAALYAAVEGTVSTSRADLGEGEEGIAVFFPGEWLRDPESRYLREYPVDVPWDEPELIEAMLALRHEL
jgi:glutathione synthase/RimK-type ligase-like ATP-grasp enzyme